MTFNPHSVVFEAVLGYKGYTSSLRAMEAETEKYSRRVDKVFRDATANVLGNTAYEQREILRIAADRRKEEVRQERDQLRLTQQNLAKKVALYNQAYALISQGAVRLANFIQTQLTESLELALERSAIEKVFEGSFGDLDISEEVVKYLDERSVITGVNQVELAIDLLPKGVTLDQLEEIAAIGSGFKILRPEKSTEDFVFALNELLAGQTKSFQNRFNIPASALNRVKELQEELGLVDGTLQGLNEIVTNFGVDLTDVFDQPVNRVESLRIQILLLKTSLGEGLLDSFLDSLTPLSEWLQDNNQSLQLFAETWGTILGNLSDFVIPDISILPDEEELNIANEFLLQLGLATQLLHEYKDILVFIQDPMRSFSDQFAELTEKSELALSIMKLFNLVLLGMGHIADTSLGNLVQLVEALSDIGNLDFGEFYRVFEERNSGLSEEFKENLNNIVKGYREGVESGGEFNETLLDQADAAQLAKAAAELYRKELEDLAETEEEAIAAAEKIAKARKDFAIDKGRAIDDQALEQSRKELDLEIDLSRERESIHRKHGDNLVKIQEKLNNDLDDVAKELARDQADAATDLLRDLEDVYRNNRRDVIDLEKDRTNALIDIEKEKAQKLADNERDLQETLKRIREKYDFDQQEAIRKNDAIAFLSLERRKKFDIDQAKNAAKEDQDDINIDTEREKSSVVEDFQRQREELKVELERQIEDVRIANERILADIKLANERRLEDIRTTNERALQEELRRYDIELREFNIKESQKREDLARSFAQQQEDFNRNWARKLQDLESGYQKELAIVRKYEAEKARLQAKGRTMAVSGSRGATNPYSSVRGETTSPEGIRTVNTPYEQPTTGKGADNPFNNPAPGESLSPEAIRAINNAEGREFGGRVFRNRMYMVGEGGPEFFIPGGTGNILPIKEAMQNRQMTSTVNNIRNESSRNFNLNGLEQFLAPAQIQMIFNMIETAQTRAFKNMELF